MSDSRNPSDIAGDEPAEDKPAEERRLGVRRTVVKEAPKALTIRTGVKAGLERITVDVG